MTLEVRNNPLLVDYVRVCIRMPDDERAQLEAFTGEPYDIDRAAVGNYMVAGPKWGVYTDGEPIAIGGFSRERPGVWRDFMLTTPQAWEHWFQLTRICRRVMDAMLISGEAHRLECIVPAQRLSSRKELDRWYKVLGYNNEGLRYGYCANGADAVAYARVKH